MSEKEQQPNESEWKALVMSYATKVVQEFGQGLVGKVRSHVEEAIANVIRRIMILFISLIGVVFIVVGLVELLNEVTMTTWAGYFIFGGLLIVVGFLSSLFGERKK